MTCWHHCLIVASNRQLVKAVFWFPPCATKHYTAHNALGHDFTFDPLFKQSKRLLLLSAVQSTPRLENKHRFVLRPAPSVRASTPPTVPGGLVLGSVCVCVLLTCPGRLHSIIQLRVENQLSFWHSRLQGYLSSVWFLNFCQIFRHFHRGKVIPRPERGSTNPPCVSQIPSVFVLQQRGHLLMTFHVFSGALWRVLGKGGVENLEMEKTS